MAERLQARLAADEFVFLDLGSQTAVELLLQIWASPAKTEWPREDGGTVLRNEIVDLRVVEG